MANRRVILSKKPYISLIIVSLASKYEKYLQEIMVCESLGRTSCGFSILLTTKVVPKIFPNLNVVGHLAVPAGWGSCLLRLAIFIYLFLVKAYFYIFGQFNKVLCVNC